LASALQKNEKINVLRNQAASKYSQKAKEYCMIVLQFENDINKSKIDFISLLFGVCECKP
jgi:hypothetical protein